MEILVLDTSFLAIGIIDSYESIVWADRYNEVGDHELYLPVSYDALSLLQKDYYLVLENSEKVMIVESLTVTTDSESGNYLLVTGRSLESILERRIVWGLKTVSGNLQIKLQELFNENLVNPTDVTRKIYSFIFELSVDPRITALTIDTQFCGENLLEIVTTLAKTYGFGFKVILNDSNQFVFSLYCGSDRSYNQSVNPYVIFSPEYENLYNSNYLSSNKNLKNVAYITGEGEGTAQLSTTINQSTNNGLNRREIYIDASDITATNSDGSTITNAAYLELLSTRGTESLAEYNSITAFEGEADTTTMFIYGKDFFLGDVVQIENEYGLTGTSIVTEITFSHDANGLTICPVFSTIE